MPQHVADLVERGTFAQHVSCQAVAQQMRANVFLRRPEPGLLECRAQHRIQDLRIGERPIRHPMRDEQGARRSTTTILDVIDDGLAGLFGQRHAVVPLALAPDQDRAGPPVDIIELDRDHLRRAQAEASQNHQHRVVAPTDRVRRPDCIDEPLNLFRLQ